jgi:hypothetical protein
VAGNDVLNGVRFVEATRVDPNILVDRDGPVVAIGIKYQSEVAALFYFRKMPLLITRFEALLARYNPYLEEVDRIDPRGIELAMRDAGSGTMRCASPGRISEPVPRLSLCASAPART